MIRVQIIKHEIVLTVLIVLTDSQKEKVENKDLQATIENIAADLKLSYAVEVNGNVAQLALSRSYSPIVYDFMEVTRKLVKASETFVEKITALEVNSQKKINLEKKRVNCAKKINDDVPYKEFKDDAKFIKQLLDDVNNKEHDREVLGCQVLAQKTYRLGKENSFTVVASAARINRATFRRLLMVYLEYYKEYLC